MRQKLQSWILIFICGSLLWMGLGCRQQASSEVNDAFVTHIVERLSFGPKPGELQRVKSMGVENYIQSQLNPESIEESPQLDSYLAQIDSLQKNPLDLLQKFLVEQKKQQPPELSIAEKNKIRSKNLKYKRKIRKEAIEAHLARATNSSRQLQEVMVDFWFNHFNVYAGKGQIDFWIADYENEIRTHALGNFRELLGVTARHPAMLIYLDNELNTDPKSKGARGRFKGLNENYARELMELHTLGVDGGYTQDDIVALARIFTGWSVNRLGKAKGVDENGFFFFPNRHDNGEKLFLGHKILPDGINEGEKALDILATHPSTAHYISYKLAQYFVADEPPANLVDSLAQKFLSSEGDIKAVMDTLIHSKEFNDPQYYDRKFKTPYQYILSLVRAGGITNPHYKRMQGMMGQLGMPVYACPTPNGYKNTRNAWLSPDGMLNRVSIATAISNGALSGRNRFDAQKLRETLGNDFSANTQQAIAQNPPRFSGAIMLGSPETMYR